MSKTLIIGATKGIGLEIANQFSDKPCVTISRNQKEFNNPNHIHYSLDVINDELPEIDDISSIIYCPGSINLKPIGSLKIRRL